MSLCLHCKCHSQKNISKCLKNFIFVIFKALEKLKRQLADADAALEASKKPPEETGPRIVGEGLVIDEWVSQ